MKITKQWYREMNRQSELKGEGLMFKEAVNGNFSTFSYVHGGLDFRDRRTRLARGLTLDENDNVVTVGFEKFFCNYQLENRDWLEEDFKEQFARLQDKEFYEVEEKVDGTLIILSNHNGNMVISTTSSTNNDFVDEARILLEKEDKEAILNYLGERNSCFIFEMVLSINQISVKYEKEELYLLAEISKETLEEIKIENTFNFKIPKVEIISKEELLRTKERTDIEGFVVKNDYGKRIKVKTDWWYEVSRIYTLFFNSRKITKAEVQAIVENYLTDKMDELYVLEGQVERKLNKITVVGKILDDFFKQCRLLGLKYQTTREIIESKEKFCKYAALIKNGKSILKDKLVLMVIEELKEVEY